MKNQALFSSKDKSKKLKCFLLQFLFGALRAKFMTEFDFSVYFSLQGRFGCFRIKGMVIQRPKYGSVK